MGGFDRGITRYTEKTKAEARALRAAGLSYYAIADKLGLSGMSLARRWCNDDVRQRENERAKLRARCQA